MRDVREALQLEECAFRRGAVRGVVADGWCVFAFSEHMRSIFGECGPLGLEHDCVRHGIPLCFSSP